MALELNKLTGPVAVMGRTMAGREGRLAALAREARALLTDQPEVSEELRRKIEVARQIDVWRRGAIPLGQRLDERRQPGALPAACIIIAADGSQIYPDRHSIAAYYLLNTGAIVLRMGSGQAPTVSSSPELFFEDADLYDADGQLRSTDYISAQRNRRELQTLADLAEAERAALGGDLSVPIVCLVDGPLLPWLRPDPMNGGNALDAEIAFFAAQMARLRHAGAIPVGYVDRPGSAYVLRILELLHLPLDGITRDALRHGRYRQLTDRQIFVALAPNERTGLFAPNLEANDRYYEHSGDRIAFTYINVGRPARGTDSAIARIETPGWVAADPLKLDIAHAIIYANCEPTSYPYVLTRAHELAVVGQAEKAELEKMLFQAMLRNGLIPEISFKATTKLWTAG